MPYFLIDAHGLCFQFKKIREGRAPEIKGIYSPEVGDVVDPLSEVSSVSDCVKK